MMSPDESRLNLHGPLAAQGSSFARPYFAFEAVSKAFGSTLILNNLSFEVGRGSTLCLMGHSGAGKSVCLLIMGFLKPDAGRVITAAEDITGYSESQFRKLHRKVAMVFPNGDLVASLTVAENVAVPLKERGSLHETQIKNRVDGLLDALGISDISNAFPEDISAGMQRWASIARALAEDPDALLLDEPTVLVDPLMVRRLVGVVQRLKAERKMTSIVVTQDGQLARRIADHILLLGQSGVLFSGTTAEMSRSSEPFIRRFLSDAVLSSQAAKLSQFPVPEV